MTSPAISVTGLRKRYGAVMALDEVSFEVAAGSKEGPAVSAPKIAVFGATGPTGQRIVPRPAGGLPDRGRGPPPPAEPGSCSARPVPTYPIHLAPAGTETRR